MSSNHTGNDSNRPRQAESNLTENTSTELIRDAINHTTQLNADVTQQNVPALHPMVGSSPTLFGSILGFSNDDDVIVQLESPTLTDEILCDVLIQPGGIALHLQCGDRVLVAAPTNEHSRGCIFGLVGRYRPSGSAGGQREEGHIVIQADQQLSFRCGDSSIEMRKDGKLMIRGNDVLSKAKRTQRIKGGNVAIN